MKRYRIFPFFDFDTRAQGLSYPPPNEWEESVKNQHIQNQLSTIKSLKTEFGEKDFDNKIKNFIDLGSKPISIIAFHNAFFSQVRSSFVIGSYYPALTGACSLGERILNHLILLLRNDFKSTVEYRKVYRKDSFDDWGLAINTLQSWNILLPTVVNNFRLLMDKRNRAIHFRPEIDHNVRGLALEAIACLQEIIGEQFSGFGLQPWFITDIPGEIYIKKDWESNPFINKIYLPNGLPLSPYHKIEAIIPQLKIIDPFFKKDCSTISDEKFSASRKKFNADGQNHPVING
jgi:hypothetical protein